MTEKPKINPTKNPFREAFGDVTPYKQDTYQVPPNVKLANRRNQNNKIMHESRQAQAYFQFSDGFEAHFPLGTALKYTKDGAPSDQVKRLRRGDLAPELILDLHGLTKEQAKSEIAALIYEAQKKHIDCVCIIHGLGAGVLKQNVPNWLIQHPKVQGFHQSPLEWGGAGALLVLIGHPQTIGKYD